MKYTLKDLARLKGEHVTFLSFTDIPNGKITITSWSIITPSLDGFPFEKCYCLLPNSVNICLLPFGLIFIIFCSKKSLWLSGWITTEKFNFFQFIDQYWIRLFTNLWFSFTWNHSNTEWLIRTPCPTSTWLIKCFIWWVLSKYLLTGNILKS